MFQKLWSGRVVNDRTAWELLTLVDQTHLWAVTEFRTFVIEHLRPWHYFCENNYLLDWDSIHDAGPQRKRKRTLSNDHPLLLPGWTDLLGKPAGLRIQERTSGSLERATKQHQLRKGKAKCSEESDPGNGDWSCMMGDCRSVEPEVGSSEALLNHMRCVHNLPKWDLSSMRRVTMEADMDEGKDSRRAPFVGPVLGRCAKRVRVC